MKQIPILFSTPMVQAILEGRKTMTRRAIKGHAPFIDERGHFCTVDKHGKGLCWGKDLLTDAPYTKNFIEQHCPYGKVGDLLYVRETWARVGSLDPGYLTFKATYPECLPQGIENVPPASEVTWKPNLHLPKADSRLWLEVTGVRPERLWDITEADAMAEGVHVGARAPFQGNTTCVHCGQGRKAHEAWVSLACPGLSTTYNPNSFRGGFQALWESINGKASWATNPWVWVVAFKEVSRTGRPD